MKHTSFISLLIALAVIGCKRQQDDAVAYSFVVVADCRVDKADTNFAANPAGANYAQLDRTFEEIATLSPKPAYIFFNGDEVFGYEHDPVKLTRAFATWRAHVSASPALKAGIPLIAIPGNHETQVDSGNDKMSIGAAEQAWLHVMAPFIPGNNGPHAHGPDSLLTDQSRLTYSLNYRDAHFILMNTDPVGNESHVPVHWIADDIANARKDGAKHIFAIGHKPAFGYGGSMAMAGGNRTEFWAALEANHAEAMIGSHDHVYSAVQPHGAKTWRIISGNGGSPLEKTLPKSKQFFGFIVVSVLKSGNVIVKSYGRDVPAEGYAAAAPAQLYPTTVRDSLDITWKE